MSRDCITLCYRCGGTRKVYYSRADAYVPCPECSHRPAGPPPLLAISVTDQDGYTTHVTLCRAIGEERRAAQDIMGYHNMWNTTARMAQMSPAMHKMATETIDRLL